VLIHCKPNGIHSSIAKKGRNPILTVHETYFQYLKSGIGQVDYRARLLATAKLYYSQGFPSVIPAGPTNLRLPHVSHWDLAIHSNSKKKEAAWQFILWATNKENILEAHLAGIPSPRNSSWESEAFLAENAYPDWTEATTISYEIGNPIWNPPVVNVPEARDVVGDIIVSAIAGEDIEPLIPSAIQRLLSIEARD
jgi:hypothetical protein